MNDHHCNKAAITLRMMQPATMSIFRPCFAMVFSNGGNSRLTKRHLAMPHRSVNGGDFGRIVFGIVTLCGALLCAETAARAQDDPLPVLDTELTAEKDEPEQPATTKPADDQNAEAFVPADHLATWLHSLNAAKDLSHTRRAPLLVIAGATWCGPCKVLEKEINKAVVQDELQRWVPVHIDVDEDPEEATELAVSSIPALRVLSPDGRLIASTEGAMDADALAAWLAEQFPRATQNAAAQVKSSGKLTAILALGILKDFRSREATVREAAISRLVAAPEVAAAPVVSGFTDGGLSEQLAYLELLATWEAPVKGIDPWIPTSLTVERIASLETWVTERNFTPPAGSDELTAAEIIEARRILRNLATANTTEAMALREHLARIGRKTLPLIRIAIENETDPTGRERLTAARYRVAGTADLELEWPGGTERLASADFDIRVNAAADLVRISTKREEPLLLELFSDPVPLVREIALKGITKISGTSAGGALVKLLDDPDPNVRAAVLKQLAESPVESLIPKIAEYAQTESDPDLVVHAIRFLREIEKHEAVKAMAALFNHQSWRVRAEAADGIYRLIKKSGMDESRGDVELGEAYLKLLRDEDEFVVGVAIRTLQYVKASDAPDRLIEVVETRPAVASTAVEALGSSFMGRRGITDKVLEFASDRQPEVRSAAAIALLRNSGEQHADIIKNGLWDEERPVRIAVANAIFSKVLGTITPKLKQISYATGSSEQAKSNTARATKSGGRFSQIAQFLTGDDDAPTAPRPQPTAPVIENNEDGNDNEAQNDSSDTMAPSRGEKMTQQRGKQIDAVLTQLRNEKSLSSWLYQFEEPLQEMLANENPDEQLAAARTLTLFGNTQAFEVLQRAASERSMFADVAAVLPGLTWTEKESIFDLIAIAAASYDERLLLADAMADTRDTRSTEKIWGLLASSDADARLVAEIRSSLMQAYFREYHYSITDAETHEQNRLKSNSEDFVKAGTHWQKIAALSLLSTASRIDMKQAAQTLYDDDSQPPELRRDALRVLMGALTGDAARQLAFEAMNASDTGTAEPAIQYFALENAAVMYMSGVVPIEGVSASSLSVAHVTPIVPKAPEGLTIEQLQPFMNSENPMTRACAAHLATLLGEHSLVPIVVQYWQSTRDNASTRRMAYRSIATSNDVQFIPVLKQMYADMKSDKWNATLADFYWTIRIMSGPGMLDLRRMIRGENDADQLRGHNNNGVFP